MKMDYDKESATFCTKLEQTREKFISQWAGEELEQLKQDILYSDSKQLQQSLEEKKDHEDALKNLRHKCQVGKKALHEHILKVKELQNELHRVNAEAEDGITQYKEIQQELGTVTDDISRERELLAAQEKAVSEKLGELEKAASMFRDRLGLKFKKTSGGRLQVVFTCVEDKDPDARFYFYVQINDGKYIVSGCEPQVENIDALIEKLNATNNFRSFVIAIRRAFKASLKN